MQLNPGILRTKIHAATGTTRYYLISALLLRDAALLAFAIGYISLFSLLFGSINSYVGVASFCILLSSRFVNYGYNIKASLGSLAAVFILMGLNAPLLLHLNPIMAWLLNWGSLLLILRLTSNQPLYGNGGVYTFAYLLVTNMPATGAMAASRWAALALASSFCGLTFYKHHRTAHSTVTGWAIIKLTNRHDSTWNWQLRLATGVACALLLGQMLHVERVMWLGFACMSLLLPQTAQLRPRIIGRLTGVIIGSLLFSLGVWLLPSSFTFLLAPIAGFGLGLTANYFLASIFNCFGALSIAQTLFGLLPAASLRIFNNGLGILVAVLIAALFNWYQRRLDSQPKIG